MRAYVQQASADRLTGEMGPGAAGISEIITEIRGKLPGLEPAPPLEPELARFRLFDSISSFLKNAAQSQPLMLVLDDLHWADRSSLLLLEFLAWELGEPRLLLVGCYRDTELSRQHPLADTLAQLSREPVFRRQVLRGLDQEELGQFIEATAGVQLAQELTGALYAHTEGNPFFMTEVIRLLSESGELTGGHIGTTGWRIPEGVREAIGQRLNRLTEQCNEVLATASIISREFDFRLLNALIGNMGEDRLLGAVDEAISAHLIEEVSNRAERFQFSHALIQQTLAEEMTTTRRVRLHARIGEALEEMYGSEAESHASELARHFAEAQTVTGTAKLVGYCLLAGEQAMTAYAHEQALEHYETGLVAREIELRGTEAAPDEEAADLLFGLARSQSATLVHIRSMEAFATLKRAFDGYAQMGNVSKLVAAVEFLVAAPTYPIPGAAEMLARALTLVPEDSHEAGRLLSRYGGVLGSAVADYEGAQQALEQAITIARREEDVALEVQTLNYAATVSANHLRW